jgi:hypothetical protein
LTYANPVVFATPATLNGAQDVTTRVTSLTSDAVIVGLDEPNYLDETHLAEDLTLLVLEKGVWDIGGGRRLEVGTVAVDVLSTEGFVDVAFDEAFDEAPVVLTQVQTANGPDWVVTRIDDVTATGFALTMQEEEALNGGGHTTETVGWLALEADVFDWNGIDIEAFSSGPTVDDGGGEFDFAAALGATPLIAAGIASFFGAEPANLRLDDLSSGTATFIAREDLSADAERSHASEVAAGIAFADEGLLTGTDVLLA